MRLKKTLLKYWKNYKKRVKENSRDVEKFETNIYNLLEELFIKNSQTSISLRKRLRLNEEDLSEILYFTRNKGYINETIGQEMIYTLEEEGKDFLLKYKNILEERNNSKWVERATIVLAISASISIVDILVMHTPTKETIFTFFSGILNFFALIGEKYFGTTLLIIIILIFANKILDYFKYKN